MKKLQSTSLFSRSVTLLSLALFCAPVILAGCNAEDFGYALTGSAGENIAAGYAGAQDTFTQWKNSPGHNANMLNGSYRVIGIGRAYVKGSPYGWYWTTDFGG